MLLINLNFCFADINTSNLNVQFTMGNLFNKLKLKFRSNLQGLSFDGAAVAVCLCIVILVVSSNIVRVFTNGQSNYSTFLLEKNERDKLQDKNNKLQQDLSYVNSDEYKQLFLRDSENLAQGNEELYQTKDKPIYYQTIPDYLDLKTKGNYNDWWGALLK